MSSTKIREDVLAKRYYLRDENGTPIEDWKGLCTRVAFALGSTASEKKEFFEVMHNMLMLPNSPALMNAGSKRLSLSACFVLPIDDSMESIFDGIKHMALVQKSGGGTGFSFSRLRPKGDKVGLTRGVASGPVSFMRIYNTATEEVKQGGKRRGANMGVLRVDHPDIMEFTTCKDKDGEFSNFNLSVGITDEFMQAVKDDGEYTLVFGDKGYGRLKAKDVFNKIIEQAWKNGEPGLLFLDRINEDNPTPHVGSFESTNPCGEQPLLPYEACVLGSINLSLMVNGDGEINNGLLEKTARTGVRMLDSVIDIQHYTLPEIEKMHKSNRKIGLGVMGWGDMLIKMKISYKSEEACALAEQIMSFITKTAEDESEKLAAEKGVFLNWEGSVWHQRGRKMRNAAVTTIAPTGSISIIADCSGGIEPVYAFVTTRNQADGQYEVVHPLFEEWFKGKYNGGKTQSLEKWLEENVTELPEYLVTAHDIPVEWHIKMQAAFQSHTHNAISKTINFREGASREEVEKAFMLAYDLNCKGITIYRDGSRKQQVISKKGPKQVNRDIDGKLILDPIRECTIVEVKTGEGKVYVFCTDHPEKDDTPSEVFIVSPVDTKYASTFEGYGRTLSTSLRYGVPFSALVEQMEKSNRKFGHVSTVEAILLKAFRMAGFIRESDAERGACPECGGVLVMEVGCLNCHSCGFTKCG